MISVICCIIAFFLATALALVYVILKLIEAIQDHNYEKEKWREAGCRNKKEFEDYIARQNAQLALDVDRYTEEKDQYINGEAVEGDEDDESYEQLYEMITNKDKKPLSEKEIVKIIEKEFYKEKKREQEEAKKNQGSFNQNTIDMADAIYLDHIRRGEYPGDRTIK